MAESKFVLVTVNLGSGIRDLAQAVNVLRLSLADVDQDFGVIPVDERGKYAMRIREKKIRDIESDIIQGPYADPEIGPFGPV